MKTLKLVALSLICYTFLISCQKDKEETPQKRIEGTWTHDNVNFIYYIDGQKLDASKDTNEEILYSLKKLNIDFKGLTYIFSGNNVTLRFQGNAAPAEAYQITETSLTLPSFLTAQYKIIGDKLILTYDGFEMFSAFGDMPEIMYQYEKIDFVWQLKKVE